MSEPVRFDLTFWLTARALKFKKKKKKKKKPIYLLSTGGRISAGGLSGTARCVCVCVWVRACVRACVRVCVCACVRA